MGRRTADLVRFAFQLVGREVRRDPIANCRENDAGARDGVSMVCQSASDATDLPLYGSVELVG